MRGFHRSGLLATAALLVLASSVLVACGSNHGEPWINPGQEQRLGDQPERAEYTEQQLRDRLTAGQAQR